MPLAEKVAVVTGSSRGIGKAIALALAREGAHIVVAARTERERPNLPGTIYTTAEDVQALGRRALPVKLDVTMDEDAENLAQRTLEEFGRIDILVNNAGIDVFGPLLDFPIRRWDLLMRLNLRGTFIVSKAFLPQMVEQRRGNIINITSLAGKGVAPGNVPYGVTKAALEYLTQGMAVELRQYNIAVNSLYPGATVDTEGNRLSQPNADRSQWEPPDTIAKAAVFIAAQDAASFTGQSVNAKELVRERGLA